MVCNIIINIFIVLVLVISNLNHRIYLLHVQLMLLRRKKRKGRFDLAYMYENNPCLQSLFPRSY